jgi:hypothetical protein
VTLSAGVITWAWSPIKFQADMGILLAFMFLWNMLGALILVPSLAAFLLPQSKLPSKDTTMGAGVELPPEEKSRTQAKQVNVANEPSVARTG